MAWWGLHVVTRPMCRYNTIEINASDDRTGRSLRARLLDALQVRAHGDLHSPYARRLRLMHM